MSKPQTTNNAKSGKGGNLHRGGGFDRLLSEALEARGPSTASGQAGQGCLDPQTLAAWADGALDARERALAEAHAADCADCQAVLAALIRTTPESDIARPWWRASTLGWLVPVTAAAAAILIWAIVPARMMQRTAPGREAARRSPTVAPVDQTTPPAPATEPQASEARTPTPSQETFARRRPPAASGTQAQAKAEARSETDTLRQPDAKSATQSAAAAAQSQTVVSPAPPSAAAQSAAAAGNLAGAPAGSAATMRMRDEPLAAPRVERSVPLDLRARSASDIASPDGRSRWQIAPAGAVRHSLDGGATWETQQTGVAIRLSAGASPSASVCWMVGPRGTVLETKDGRSWRRIDFPESVDLVSVRATDDQTATVVAADGRTFSTVDGGLSWTPARQPFGLR